jgi:4-hydroxy-3-polyprenylbenzoate decarboxylase
MGSSMPVLINAFGSPKRMAWALGVNDLDELNHKLAAVIDMRPLRAQGLGAALNRANDVLGVIRSIGLGSTIVNHAPCQQVVHTGNDFSLSMLPILKCWPKDGGRYITLPQVITRDPLTNTRNVGMYRLQVLDAGGNGTLHTPLLGMHWQRHKGGAEHERVAREEAKLHIPCAVALGGDPAAIWCASAPLPPNIDEYLLAGCAASLSSSSDASLSLLKRLPMPRLSSKVTLTPRSVSIATKARSAIILAFIRRLICSPSCT